MVTQQYEDDEKFIGGQNLITGTHDGSVYADAGGEKYEKTGTLSGQVYKFSKPFTLTDVISIENEYTLSFLVYIPPNENTFKMNMINIKIFGVLSDQPQEVYYETSNPVPTDLSRFKLVKITFNIEDLSIPIPASITISSPTNTPFTIADLKLEYGSINTAWCKSIDDAVVNIPPNLLNKPKLGRLTIPITGWVDFTGDPTGFYKKSIDVPLEGATTQHVVNGTVLDEDNMIACDCYLSGKTDTSKTGFVTFFAGSVPTAEIRIDYIMIEGKYPREDNGIITIPIEGWIDSGVEYYAKKLVMKIDGVTPNDYFMGSPSFATNDIAVECELYSIESGDGTITFLSKTVPSAPIDFEYVVVEGDSSNE